MSVCRHCGQGALNADALGPICPDCIEEGYAESAAPETTAAAAEYTRAPTVNAELLEALEDMNALFSADAMLRNNADVNAALNLARAAISKTKGGAA